MTRIRGNMLLPSFCSYGEAISFSVFPVYAVMAFSFLPDWILPVLS